MIPKDLKIDFDKLIGRTVNACTGYAIGNNRKIAKVHNPNDNDSAHFDLIPTPDDKTFPYAPWNSTPECKFTTEYTVDYCVANNIIIHCAKKNEDTYVRTILHNAGQKYCNEDSYMKNTCWDRYQEKSCYNPARKKYADLGYYKNKTIISAVWFIVDNLNLLTETKTGTMKNYKVTRQFIGEIYQQICDTWQAKIKDQFELSDNPFTDEFEIDEKTLRAWLAVAKTEVPAVYKALLAKWPELKETKELDLTDATTWGTIDRIYGPNGTNMLTIAELDLHYRNKAFALCNEFNWKLEQGSTGKFYLIPTKKN